jgi:hypothetical protein
MDEENPLVELALLFGMAFTTFLVAIWHFIKLPVSVWKHYSNKSVEHARSTVSGESRSAE